MQVASNTEGYVLAIRASQNHTDIYELIPMIEELERMIGKVTPDILITVDDALLL